ncbi:MAG: amino acid ABC transporter permease [Candidatus Methylomirabilia bacterium]
MDRAIPAELILPPRASIGPLGWLRANLFSTWYNIILTLLILWFFASMLPPLARWMVFEATWATTPEACHQARQLAQASGGSPGACWAVIPANLRLFLIGTYPSTEAHRVVGALAIVGALGFLTALRRTRGKAVTLCWVLSVPAIIALLHGFPGSAILPRVDTMQWGGLMLTFLLAIVAIVASFPLGVLLALGRRSRLPVVRLLSTVYIEAVRGVPLVTILFMSSVMFPLLIPGHLHVDKVVRAMLALTLFSAAYLAENVRGGLQAIPRGQYDAARALGLGNALTMGLIILPQALRAVIPPIVGQFIGLFKDTSLVAVVGLLDLFEIARSILSNPDWLGLRTEVLIFISAVYWAFSYSMSSASRRLEQRLGVGTR